MAATIIKKRVRAKISFKDELEKRKTDLEELNTQITIVQELRNILAQTIKDQNCKYGSEQNEVPILTDEERLFIKNKMLFIINKFF